MPFPSDDCARGPLPLHICTRAECSMVYLLPAQQCPLCGGPTVTTFYPWNDLHPCFDGSFDSSNPFEHDWHYEDTSRGDGLYFQQSGHMECRNCGHCESADGFYGDDF